MPLTARQLNRATLARQMLLEREAVDPVAAVRRLVGVQAQEPASPYVALWSRVRDLQPNDLDVAFGDFALVKASLMRITLHAVAAQDRGTLHAAMRGTLRAAGLGDRRFGASGLSAAEAEALVPVLVEFAQRPRRRGEFETLLEDRIGDVPVPGVWRALRMVAPLVHAPIDAPWSFGRVPAFVAAPDAHEPADRNASVRELIRRYLAAFGPATRQDVAQFALLRQTDLAPAFEELEGTLETLEGADGAKLFDVRGAPVPDEDAPAPARLLAMWDSALLAYKDRGRVLPPAYRGHVIRRNGDVLPTVLVDGYVAGVWRHLDDGVEVTAFEPLGADAWEGIACEARSLLRFVGERDDALYGRYGHWWSRLPEGQVRRVRLGGPPRDVRSRTNGRADPTPFPPAKGWNVWTSAHSRSVWP